MHQARSKNPTNHFQSAEKVKIKQNDKAEYEIVWNHERKVDEHKQVLQTNWTDNHEKNMKRLNWETVQRLMKSADNECMLEHGLVTFLSKRDVNDSLNISMLNKYMQTYANKTMMSRKGRSTFGDKWQRELLLIRRKARHT